MVKKTVLYEWYKCVKYSLYPMKLRRANVNKNKPTEYAIRDSHSDNKRLIVSLTSFPGRIKIVHNTLYSIMNQDYKPDMIILWLAEGQFPNKEKDLPNELIELKQFGLIIRWVEKDLKSYKKLIHAIQEYPEDIIITADDDLYYPKYWISSLVESYNENPQDIHCHLITRLKKDENGVDVVKRTSNMINDASYNNKLLGGSGSLYPPHSLHEDVTNEVLFSKLAPTSDDIWFWAMALRNKTKIRWIKNNMRELYYTEYSQENTDCLWKVNDCGEKLFVKHMRNVIEALDLYEIIL